MHSHCWEIVSIGISHNIMLARLATRRAKPAGSYHLVASEVASFLAPLEIDNLWGFGRSTSKKVAEKLGATTLGELAKKNKAVLCDALGKGTGEKLYKAVRGIDEQQLQSDKPRKSVSCEINVSTSSPILFQRPLILCLSICSTGLGLRVTSKRRSLYIKWPKKFLAV